MLVFAALLLRTWQVRSFCLHSHYVLHHMPQAQPRHAAKSHIVVGLNADLSAWSSACPGKTLMLQLAVWSLPLPSMPVQDSLLGLLSPQKTQQRLKQ